MASGYARVLASVRTKQQQTKPLFGKPYLKYGECLALAGYFMQLGALLGAKYRDKPDAFVTAFLGLEGEAGAAMRFFVMVDEVQSKFLRDPMTFIEFVTAEQVARLEFDGNPDRLMLERGLTKISQGTAAEMVLEFAEMGVVLGVMHPSHARSMFEYTYRPRDKERWQYAQEMGLNIPSDQEDVKYEEVQGDEDVAFTEYCEAYCPNLLQALIVR